MRFQEEKLGVVYHSDYLVHTHRSHPERKERLEKIMEALAPHMERGAIKMVTPGEAGLESLALIHDYDYIHSVEEACLQGRSMLDMDTYIVPRSYRVALLAAGGALAGLKEVMEGECRKTFCLVRPPGHHAEGDQAMGFCLFNNIAIAARAARDRYNLKRVAIVDWDVHHGNGTQHSFEDDAGMLFISLHQSPAYPGTGRLEEVGRGPGEGFTVNIPLPPGSGDGDYTAAFEQLVVPILEAYQPEMLLISSGQDAYFDDPLAGMELTLEGYQIMAEMMRDVAGACCQGRMLLCLEGGYHLQGQAAAVVRIMGALGRWETLGGCQKTSTASPPVLKRLEEALLVQRRYWPL